MSEEEHFVNRAAVHVAEFLRAHLGHVEELYDWGISQNAERRLEEGLEFKFDDQQSSYQKTLEIKRRLVGAIEQFPDFESTLEYAELFIKIWGKISGHKSLSVALKPFFDAKDASLTRMEPIQRVNGISSWSKYLVLLNSRAAIYDSRVAYSINAINYINSNTNFLFYMPESQSRRLNLVDIETLFVLQRMLTDKSFLSPDDIEHRHMAIRARRELQIGTERTYVRYLQLLEEVANILELPNNEQFKIEMLLFALAPTQVLSGLIDFLKQKH